ncbi:hypothetical protein ACB094_03G038300 [Castanea mollissima]
MGKINPYLPLFLIASCLFFISHSQTTSNTSSQQRCLPDQSSALLQLRQEFVEKRLHSDDMYDLLDYNDYYNVSYPRMKSWKADSDCCSSWDGVTCDAHNGHVIGLDLSNSWLYGPLNSNSALFRLRHLQKLNLALNNFSSSTTIPSEFGRLVSKLKSLSHLDLSRANFSGELPNSIGNLKSLSHLDLSHADFLGELPSSIGKLESLNALYLRSTIFFGKLPDSIGNLKSLNYLELDSSNFSGEIPPTIGNLSQLTSLSLSSNNFHGQLPSTLENLAKLTFLDLSYNLFSGKVPSSLGNLTQLEELSLSNNNFEGKFPISLTNITKLISIDISGNQLKGSIPSEISRLTKLSSLDLSQNSLTGAIPSVLYTMPSLSVLYLDQNQLTGPLQFQNTSSSQLNALALSGNKLDGPVPRSISNFTKLHELYLSSINLKDKMELNIFFLFKGLQYLDLSGNNLSVSKEKINSTHPKFSYLWLSSCNLHEFPDFLKAQNELETLDLSNNKIEGKIPKWFCNVGKGTLRYLNLSFNLINDFEQPLKVLPWKFIDYLDLRSNMLQGSLPIPPLSTSYFFASNNNLTGKIPRMICKVNSLQVLDISNNQLNGHIQQCLGHFSSSLVVLNMRNNCFQGSMPKSFIKGCRLTTLDLSHNQIQGKIPRSLVQCQMLEVLNLGNNNINEAFPFWLQSLPELRILVLRANGFHGPIWAPHTGFGFSKLHVIDLSHNNFSGRLPSEYFRTWNAMQVVPAKDKSQPAYMGSQSNYYEDSMTVVNKGLEIFLVKILTIFIAIDLSNNRFDGEIPNSVGNLKGLIVLNLSSNSFMDRVPSSLGNLVTLESLDLSQNKLSGKIPQQLINLTFLEYLNLSQNQLVGPIPQGGQFWTFENSSFEGNLGLCGSPLSKKCGNNETQTYKTRQESSIVEGLDWKVVVIGYACGLIIGIVIGYFYTSRRTVWFMRNFGVHIRS